MIPLSIWDWIGFIGFGVSIIILTILSIVIIIGESRRRNELQDRQTRIMTSLIDSIENKPPRGQQTK